MSLVNPLGCLHFYVSVQMLTLSKTYCVCRTIRNPASGKTNQSSTGLQDSGFRIKDSELGSQNSEVRNHGADSMLLNLVLGRFNCETFGFDAAPHYTNVRFDDQS